MNHTKRAVKEGLAFGIVAGILFAMMEVVGAAVMGNPLIMPLRMFASTVLGMEAMQATPAATVFIVGSIVHLALSGLFGVVYGFLGSRLSRQTETSLGRQAAMGLLFGAGLWLVNFQIIGRMFYPWFLESPQFLQMAMHAMFFGLPLGLMYAAAERRAAPAVGAPAAYRG